VRSRAGRRRGHGIGRLAALVGAALAAAGGVHAEKKKPGLFDFQTWKAPVTREREAARELAPVPLDVTPLGETYAQPRVLRVRFYVDRDYRGAVLDWQS
jgi:hypothetical protein